MRRIKEVAFAAVTAPARMLLQAMVAVIATAVITGALLWATQNPQAPVASGQRSPATPVQNGSQAPPQAEPLEPAPEPTLAPTPAPTPVPTPTPMPVDFYAAIDQPDWQDVYGAPVPDCAFNPAAPMVAGAWELSCQADASAELMVVAAAAGRVVHVSRTPALAEPPATENGVWSWTDLIALGPYVIIDHGPYDGASNVQTVYGGLTSVDETIEIGKVMVAGDPLGAIVGSSPTLHFSIWADAVRLDGAAVLAAAPELEVQQLAAAAIGAAITTPTDERCPIVLGASQLPGSSRPYRNGTHRGIDFGCGAGERTATAIADGQVVFVVSDYQDPSVAEREALLASAGLAGFTPEWTLVMLYGNVVVIDHGVIDGAGRVITIAAHLESVEPDITLGATVKQGQPLGEIGNRGTNASAQGIRGGADPSLHLHWEIYVDGWYLGAGQTSSAVQELVTTAMCGAAPTSGCPG